MTETTIPTGQMELSIDAEGRAVLVTRSGRTDPLSMEQALERATLAAIEAGGPQPLHVIAPGAERWFLVRTDGTQETIPDPTTTPVAPDEPERPKRRRGWFRRAQDTQVPSPDPAPPVAEPKRPAATFPAAATPASGGQRLAELLSQAAGTTAGTPAGTAAGPAGPHAVDASVAAGPRPPIVQPAPVPAGTAPVQVGGEAVTLSGAAESWAGPARPGTAAPVILPPITSPGTATTGVTPVATGPALVLERDVEGELAAAARRHDTDQAEIARLRHELADFRDRARVEELEHQRRAAAITAEHTAAVETDLAAARADAEKATASATTLTADRTILADALRAAMSGAGIDAAPGTELGDELAHTNSYQDWAARIVAALGDAHQRAVAAADAAETSGALTRLRAELDEARTEQVRAEQDRDRALAEVQDLAGRPTQGELAELQAALDAATGTLGERDRQVQTGLDELAAVGAQLHAVEVDRHHLANAMRAASEAVGASVPEVEHSSYEEWGRAWLSALTAAVRAEQERSEAQARDAAEQARALEVRLDTVRQWRDQHQADAEKNLTRAEHAEARVHDLEGDLAAPREANHTAAATGDVAVEAEPAASSPVPSSRDVEAWLARQPGGSTTGALGLVRGVLAGYDLLCRIPELEQQLTALQGEVSRQGRHVAALDQTRVELDGARTELEGGWHTV